MKYLNSYLTLLVAILLWSCKDGAENSTVVSIDDSVVLLSEEQFSHAQMKLGELESHNFKTSISLNGHTEVPPHNKVTLSTYYGGYISYSPYLIGDYVKKGQLLIKMKNPEFIELQENYLKAHESYQFLKVDYQRQEELYNKSVISDQEFQKLKKDYKSALANVASLAAQLDLLDVDLENLKQGNFKSEIEIHAPIDGVVSQVDLNLGVYIKAQSKMMELVNYSDLHLELDVFEKDIDLLEKGQQIEFSVVGSATTYLANLELIGSEVEEEHRTLTIHADLNEPNDKLRPGLFVNAVVYANPQELDALPKEAFISSDNQFFVLVLEHQDENSYHFRKQAVTINRSDETHRSFNSKALKGEQFLISGGFQLF